MVDSLDDVYNNKSKFYECTGLFTPKPVLETIIIWNNSIKKEGKDDNCFFLIQSLKNIQSLILYLYEYIKF